MTREAEILALIASWGPAVIALLNKHGYFSLDREDIEPEEILKELGPSFDREAIKASVAKNSKIWPLVWAVISSAAFASGVAATAKQINVPQSAYNWNPLAQKFYDDHGDFFIRAMSNTDIASLHQRIQYDFNLNPKDFAKKFADSYSCSPARLERIKRSEVHASAQGGSWNFANEADCNYKQWMCTPKNRWPRPSHRANWYQVKALEDPFANGEIYPGQVNCRCFMLYFLDREHLKWGAKKAA